MRERATRREFRAVEREREPQGVSSEPLRESATRREFRAVERESHKA